MLRGYGLLGVVLSPYLIVPVANPQVPASEAEYAAGISVREKGDYRAALQHLRRAVDLDPTMTNARFALATVAEDLCTPNGGELCELTIREYKAVLELDASREGVLRKLAYQLYSANRLDESESYYRSDLARHPDDPELLCAVAAVGFQRVWRDVARTKGELGLRPGEPLIQSPSCDAARERNWDRIEEGIALLTRALRVRNRNSGLMGYLSVFYVARAEIQCRNRRAFESDVNAARRWDRSRMKRWQTQSPNEYFRWCPPAPPPMPHGR